MLTDADLFANLTLYVRWPGSAAFGIARGWEPVLTRWHIWKSDVEKVQREYAAFVDGYEGAGIDAQWVTTGLTSPILFLTLPSV